MNYDSEKMGDVLDSFLEQCKHAVELARGVRVRRRPKNIIICGMGGSGIGGKLIEKFCDKVPIFSHQDYFLPKVASKDSLILIVSYSGNTEEPISSYRLAKKLGAEVISITSGGKLAMLDKNAIVVPKGYCPRNVVGYLFLTPLLVLSNNGLVSNQRRFLNEGLKLIGSSEIKKVSKRLARKIKGKIPVFYSSNILAPVAYSFKTHINENAKQPSYTHVFPEMDHNEILGFKFLGKKMVAVFLEDSSDYSKIKKRMLITKNLIRAHTSTLEINFEGKSLLAKMLYGLYLGDYVSYYLALENGVNPSSQGLINQLKEKIK